MKAPPFLVDLGSLALIGGAWLWLYWRAVDPLLRAVLGRLLRVTLVLDEHNIWRAQRIAEELQIRGDDVVQREPLSDGRVFWSALLCRLLQHASMLGALLAAVVLTILLREIAE